MRSPEEAAERAVQVVNVLLASNDSGNVIKPVVCATHNLAKRQASLVAESNELPFGPLDRERRW